MYPTYSYTYCVPYVICVFILVFLAIYEYRKPDRKETVRKICICWFILFIGFRGFISYDWMAYYPAFESVDILTDFSYQSFVIITVSGREMDIMEPGYVLYMSFLKMIWNNWPFFVLISSALDIWVVDKFFRRFSPNYAFALMIFFALHNGLEFNLMRNIKALILFVLSFDSLYKRQWGKFVLWSILGFSFHRTFLLFIPFYFFGLKNLGKKLWWGIFFIINVVYILQIPVFSILLQHIPTFSAGAIAEKVEGYSQSEIYSVARGFTLGYIIRVIVFFLVMKKYDEILARKKEYILILNIYLGYIIVSIGMTDFSVFVNRVEYLYGFSLWIIFPLLCDLYVGWKKQLYMAFVFSYCLMRITSQTSNAMFDYENVLIDAVSYDARYRSHQSIANEIMYE